MMYATAVVVMAALVFLWGMRYLAADVFWILFPFNVFHVWIALSGFVIESGAYMRELDAFGSAVGSTIYYSAYVVLFNLLVVLVVRSVYRPRAVTINLRKMGWAINLLLLTAFILGAQAFYYGTPILTGVDRFTYLESVGFLRKKGYLLHYAAGFILGIG
jgi:hypothetical protein